MDKLTPEQRHKNMVAVRNKDTGIELLLRKELWSRGIRYRKNVTKIFGKPDIAFIGKKVAVFCDSEFWHGFNWDVKKYEIKSRKDRYNKFQVLKCPWCGTKLVKERVDNHLVGQWGYMMRNNAHFYMACPQTGCPFNDELPVQIVDQELYIKPPTLLFGTVDKFAMLPWKKEIGSFFAEGSQNRTPELIIQDELHLISGPLGTMVGLYETVIDALCSAKCIRPKIVASTATIRRAKEQCSALYNREVVQFPAPGLDSDDSFSSRRNSTKAS